MDKRPLIGVGVFVVKDGKILMGKRLNSHGHETWSIPGGHLEWMETLEGCAKREVLEETGIEVENISFVTITNDFFPEDKHYVTIYMLSECASGTARVREKNKFVELRWVSPDNLPKPLFLPVQRLLDTGFSIGSMISEMKSID
ncbi:MAG TPA: hypothetical protein DD725_12645 [Deltaproteobacteria bacterium]|nr:hypothetical protein [Deltaproteobacteria bacterium]